MKNRKLVALRNQKGLTQIEAAKLIGISPSMLAMMETGTRIGTYKTLKKVADFYGVAIEELFDENFFEDKSHETGENTGIKCG